MRDKLHASGSVIRGPKEEVFKNCNGLDVLLELLTVLGCS